MELNIFTVFDSAANAFLQPFFAPTIETAIRSFRELVNEPNHQFHKFPEDYVLFHVGTFDQNTGQTSGFDAPRNLGIALTFLPSPIPNGQPVPVLEEIKS